MLGNAGIPVSTHDVESIDPEYANNLLWLLDHEIDTLDLGLTFSVETDVFGTTDVIELKESGSGITVTDDNKVTYDNGTCRYCVADFLFHLFPLCMYT